MIFAVIPLENVEHIEKKLLRFGDKVYDEEGPTVFFVDFDGSARSLAKKPDIGVDGREDTSGVVIEVSDYFGYAEKSLWK